MSRIIVELAQPLVRQCLARPSDGQPKSLEEVAQLFHLDNLGKVIQRFFPMAAVTMTTTTRVGTDKKFSSPLFRIPDRLTRAASTQPPLVRRKEAPSADRLAAFFAIDVGGLPEPEQDKLLAALQSLDGIVASASFEAYGRPAQGGNEGATLKEHQHYLDAIGAVDTSECDWHGIGFAELDVGWWLDHEALEGVTVGTTFVPHNVARPRDRHGTMVLGVVVGGPKIQGIASGAAAKALLFCSAGESIAQSLIDFLYSDQLDNLRYGDVLVIELEHAAGHGVTEGLPLEVQREVFEALQFAASQGIVVVEAAGNGSLAAGNGNGWNLDDIAEDKNAAPAWARPTPTSEVPNSGAILVSGCESPQNAQGPIASYNARNSLNYGSRVDCYGWGAGVYTCTTPQNYESNFSMTSSAAAMIAGIALATQRMAVDAFKWPLGPAQLRALLKNRACGTPVFRNGAQVGVVPHLDQIKNLFDELPRISIGDSAVTAAAPVLTPVAPAIPVAIVFRAASGETEEEDPLPLASAQQHHIYLPVFNWGDAPADDVLASAYWAVHDDPQAPVVWNELDESATVVVPHGGAPIWVGPIELTVPTAASLPQGKIDIMVVAGGSLDPLPLLPPLRELNAGKLSRSDLSDFVAANNSAAMRTFRIV